jgi:FkbM family methyltransferase
LEAEKKLQTSDTDLQNGKIEFMSPTLDKLKTWRYRTFYRVLVSQTFGKVTLGNPVGGCAWTICPAYLEAGSTVYSGGVGNDVSFEHELVKRFGCEVVLCDPSPTGARTMSLPENKTPQLHFAPVALANCSGKLRLSTPLNRGGDWWLSTGAGGDLEVPCTDLSALMHEHGHKHIDLLKLDIEGSEYMVIDDFLARQIPVRQVCVEYHHGLLPGIRRSLTIKSILKLLRHGYSLIDQTAENHTFLRKRWPFGKSA